MPKPVSTVSRRSELKRVGKFGAVGLLNTAIDFVILNILHLQLGWALIPANTISTTVAMIFSFFANKQVVFKHHQGSWWRQVIVFYLVTAFGLYALQNGIMALLTDIWPQPIGLAVAVVHMLGLGPVFSDAFVRANTAKVIGTLASLTWNYIMYKKVVFAYA